MAREQLKTLTEPMYYILLALKEKRYGYEIMKFIEEFTEGRVIVGPGTLYALLARFEEEKIIEMLSLVDRRKNYIITSYGQEILEEERQRLIQLIEDGDRILEAEKPREEDREVEAKTIFKRSDSEILF